MARRIIIFSSFPLCIILAAMAVVFVGIGRGQQAKSESAKQEIISLIESRKWSQADAAVDKLVTEFAGNAELAGAFYQFAETYLNLNRFEEATKNFEQIKKSRPDGLWADRANLGIERVKVLTLIETRDFNSAAVAIDMLINDFNDQPDFAYTLYWIAERYERQSKFEDAGTFYQKVMNDFPNDPYANKSQMGLAQAEVKQLITSQKFEQAQESLDEFIYDFNDRPDLAESVYWIVERFGRFSRYEEAKQYYEQIVNDFPDTIWAEKSRFCIAQADVMLSFVAGDYNAANEATNALINDFNDQPDLPGALYWLTERYERIGRLEDANGFYQYIADNFPESIYAERSRLGLATIDALNFVLNGDYNEVNAAVDGIIADFNGNARLPHSVFRLGNEYYEQAYEMSHSQTGLTIQAEDKFEKARAVWEKLIMQVQTANAALIAEAYYFTAGSYRETGDYQKALELYQKVTRDYPDYQYIWSAYYLVGECYENLVDSNAVPVKTTEPLIEQAYKTVIEKYPDCPHVEYALHKMGSFCFRKGRFAEAAQYFERLLHNQNMSQQSGRQLYVLFELGMAYQQTGDLNSAEQTYRLFLEKAPTTDKLINVVKKRLEYIQKVKDGVADPQGASKMPNQ